MSVPASVAPSVPFSEQYRSYFNNERMEHVPEGLRPGVRSVLDGINSVIVTCENEIERLNTKDGAITDLISKIGLVALTVVSLCLNPFATLAGAAFGVAFSDRVIRALNAFSASSPIVKTAIVIGAIAVTFASGDAAVAIFTARNVAESIASSASR